MKYLEYHFPLLMTQLERFTLNIVSNNNEKIFNFYFLN